MSSQFLPVTHICQVEHSRFKQNHVTKQSRLAKARIHEIGVEPSYFGLVYKCTTFWKHDIMFRIPTIEPQITYWNHLYNISSTSLFTITTVYFVVFCIAFYLYTSLFAIFVPSYLSMEHSRYQTDVNWNFAKNRSLVLDCIGGVHLQR